MTKVGFQIIDVILGLKNSKTTRQGYYCQCKEEEDDDGGEELEDH